MTRRLLKRVLEPTPLYNPLRGLVLKIREQRELRAWQEAGRPAPPPAVIKHRQLRRLALEHGLRIFVETGTHRGDTVEAMRRQVDRVISIELDWRLAARARRRFRRHPQVRILHGDSARLLEPLLRDLDRPALFWLDAHVYELDEEAARGEEETPVLKELESIHSAPASGHVVVVDDARLFGAEPGYPSLDELCQAIAARRPDVHIEVEDDMIRLLPPGSSTASSRGPA
jgi:hypothetical protein